jgi:DNA repair protein RecN (Recombination protein N)
LTGETGAGKSIIIGALGAILGNRVDASILRTGASKAVVEASFSINKNKILRDFLCQNDLSSTDESIILRREIYDNGRSRAFVNDTPVPLSTLQVVGDFLVDLHGQHEHQSLLKVQNHLRFIDEFGNLKNETETVTGIFKKLQELQAELTELENHEKSVTEKKEFFRFQINEIDKVNPQPDEEVQLLKEERILTNSQRLLKLTNELYHLLYEDNFSVYDQLSKVDDGLTELQQIDDKFASLKNDCQTARLTVDELAKFLQRYNSIVEFNPERLEEIQNRLSLLSNLKKKYGPTIEAVLSYREKIEAELDKIQQLDTRLDSIREEIEQVRHQYSNACIELSKKRKNTAKQLQELIPEILSFLGMAKSKFEVIVEHVPDENGYVCLNGKNYSGTAKGMDSIEFYISTNPGEALKPLAKVASGGEISRIMLALKSVAAKSDQIPILIFDEIDMGISGRIAQAVGRKLKELSEYHQIICITHLPQIASIGEHHYFVEKYESSGRTETNIRKLSSEERAKAVAMLLAGDKISDAHMKSARELLKDSTFN